MSDVIPFVRLREAAADPIRIPEPCGRDAIARRGHRFEAVPGQAATRSIQRSGRFIGWLTQDAANGGVA